MRALKTTIRGLSKPQFARLKELTHHSKNLYNQALWVLREAFESTGLYFTYPKMDKAMKQVVNLEGQINYKFLKAKVAQQTLRRLDNNFKSFFQCHTDWLKNPSQYQKKPKPPQFKQRPHDNLIYDYQAFSVKDGMVVLEPQLTLSLPKPLIGQTIKQIEIIPKYHYFEAVFVYENAREPKTISPNENVMAIDLGLNNLATIVTNGIHPPWILDGRRLKSINHHYNKRLAKHQSQLKSTRAHNWSNRLQRLTDRRQAQVRDYLHKATSKVTKWCVLTGIGQVVVGDVTRSLNAMNLGPKTNQNFVNLALGQFVDKLRYKLELQGISLVVVNESYTSKASFVDSDPLPRKYQPQQNLTFRGKRIQRGLYRCRNGTLINADVNGAYNILRKSNPKFAFTDLVEKVGEGISDWLHPYTRLKV